MFLVMSVCLFIGEGGSRFPGTFHPVYYAANESIDARAVGFRLNALLLLVVFLDISIVNLTKYFFFIILF